METAIAIIGILVGLIILFGLAVFAAFIIRIQEVGDKLIDLDRR